MSQPHRLLSGLCLSGLLLGSAQAEPRGLEFDQVPATSGQKPERTARAHASPLGLEELNQLLRRLAPLKAKPADRTDFALRPASLPAPKTGKRIQQDFPPVQKMAPPTLERKPVEVLRYGPEGDVELAPNLSVTFNQPMTDLSSAASPASVPVKLSPDTPGEWRWVGTQTLIFQPKTRLPMATEFKAEISQAQAPNGSGLKAPVSWTFRTPPVVLKQSFPSSSGIGLNPVMFLGFDQRVDAARLASLVQFSGGAVRQATRQEILDDPNVKNLVDSAEPERWLALVATAQLKPGTGYSLTLPAGTPSLEGPRTTSSPQSVSFSTYDPLRITYQSPDDQPPGSPLYINFNNALDPKKFKASDVLVTPELPGMRAVVRGSSLWIHGRTKGRTAYTITVPASLTDSWGQRFGTATPITIKIGSARPMFVPPNKTFVVLDPVGPSQLSFTTINHKSVDVQVYAVEAKDWKAYQEGLSHRWDQKEIQWPGQKVMDEHISAEGPVDELRDVKLDLTSALQKSHQLIVVASPDAEDPSQRRYQRYFAWVQRSQLGLNLAADGDQMLAWVTRLADGKPVEGAQVRFSGQKDSVRTGKDGLAELKWGGESQAVLVENGEDQLFIPASTDYWAGTFNPGKTGDQTLWFVNDDRRLYKPGETVSIKGWLRRQIHQHRGDIEQTSDRNVNWKLFDSRGNEVSKGQTGVGGLGGFDFKFELPKNFNLGDARLELRSDSSTHSHSFQVQEFRRPEFEVSTEALSGSSVVGGRATVAVEAKYYAGGGLKDAPVNWSVTASPTNYSPPHWEGYSFGTWTPWWNCYCWWAPQPNPSQSKAYQGRTNHAGKDTLELEFKSADPPRPYSVEASATVTDVNRQAWSSSTSLIVHPSSFYVGIKARSTFVEAGKPLVYDVITTDLDGKAVAGKRLVAKAYRLSWEYSDSDYKTVNKEVFSQSFTSGSAPLEVSVPTSEGGTYQFEVTLEDDSNRRNQSQMTSWVAGGKQPPKRDVEMEQLTLVPNKKDYQPGEVAEILVQSPFSGAQALVTLERHGVVSRQMLDLSSGSATLKVPLEEAFMPNLSVTVDAVGQEPRTDEEGNAVAGAPPRPAHAQASLNLPISARSRQLTVEVKPAQPKAEPGSQNALEVKLKDASGKPVAGAEVALYVVDESVLALAGGDYSDPWDLFYALRGADTRHITMRQYIELALAKEVAVSPPPPPMQEAMPSAAPAGMVTRGMALDGDFAQNSVGGARRDMRFRAGKDEEGALKKAKVSNEKAPEPIRVRKDFSALAYYIPSAKTDGEGRIKLPFKLPDNLTRYRVVALAVAGEKQFGKGQSSLVAQQPLMVRPSPPRFLNFGDRCELPITLQNQTDHAMAVQLACRATNLKVDPKQAGITVQVPANDRVEVRIPVSAEEAGTARFQVGASSGSFADAAELDFPVWTPATTEAFATYGTLDEGAIEQTVAPPTDIFRQFGGLEVSTSSTALAELTDAFLYLRSYPFECAEQVSSRVLSEVALAPVLRAFEAPGMPTEAVLKESLLADIKKLQGMQNYDGGWDYWVREKPSVPYVSLHVTHALVRLKKAGYQVPEDTYRRALEYSNLMENHIPPEYGEYYKRYLRSYALYVMRLAGKPDGSRCRRLISEWGGVEKTPLECLGWMLPTLSEDAASKEVLAQVRRHLNNRVTETASMAQFVSAYDDKSWLILASDHRDDAILLEALIQDQPDSDLLPKLVRNLLDHRVAGRWANTQENCFVLLALDEYFQKFEKVTPDFVARLWLGDQFAGEQSFKGRSADTKELRVPMAAIQGKQNLILNKSGPGRLYYRFGMKYAPTSLKQSPMERGFSVERRYEAVDDNRDVRRDAEGVWHIKSGARVKVHLTMVCPSMRYHVALVDPLPAGLEAINPALKGSQPPPRQAAPPSGRRWWWNPWWYEHENLRDERVEAFSQWVYYGVHDYDYYARATTPGNFVVPATKAEEMYHPETFGRSASDRVVVED
ncbi:MAG: alpha-2-macroglobulin family protein [Vulcanimicrobiota bacterium]